MTDQDSPKRPNFLCIGAARAGTSWLHRNLRQHSQLWLPPLKELHYWDFERPGWNADYPLGKRKHVFGWLRWRYRHTKQIVNRWQIGLTTLGWALRYQFGWRSDRWYANLFPTDRVAGEITPGYMLISRPVIDAVRALNPDLKIILLLRDPLSRAWSNLRLMLGDKVFKASDEKILKGMEAPSTILRGDYVRAIANWRSVFDEKQFYIGFYDDLVANPRDLLRSVLTFLGVDADDSRIPPDIDRVVHKSKSRELPEHLRPRLYAPYLDQLRELERMLGGHVSKWLAKAEDAVSSSAGREASNLSRLDQTAH